MGRPDIAPACCSEPWDNGIPTPSKGVLAQASASSTLAGSAQHAVNGSTSYRAVGEWSMPHAWKACMRQKRIISSNLICSAGRAEQGRMVESWQTRWSEGPVGRKLRAGSNPAVPRRTTFQYLHVVCAGLAIDCETRTGTTSRICGRGGAGRRGGLKNLCPKGLVGSNPTARTIAQWWNWQTRRP